MLMINRRSLLTAATALAATGGGEALAQVKYTPGSPPKTAAKKNPNSRNILGKILYIGDEDNERGREWFSFSFRQDGEITLRAYCEIDDGRVERDVTYTMDSKFRPKDCFVRLTVQGKFLGTGWIRVTDTEAECEVLNTTMGRVRQVMPLPQPALSLGAHPLACDAMNLPAFDHAKPEKIQTHFGLSSSPMLDGASGPFISASMGAVEYVGPEKTKTVAGTFDAHHYRFPVINAAAHPSGNPIGEDIWVTQPDFVFVRAEVRGYLKNKTGFGRYELVEYQA